MAPYKKIVPKTEARYAELSKQRGKGRLSQGDQSELNVLRGERKGKGRSYAVSEPVKKAAPAKVKKQIAKER